MAGQFELSVKKNCTGKGHTYHDVMYGNELIQRFGATAEDKRRAEELAQRLNRTVLNG